MTRPLGVAPDVLAQWEKLTSAEKLCNRYPGTASRRVPCREVTTPVARRCEKVCRMVPRETWYCAANSNSEGKLRSAMNSPEAMRLASSSAIFRYNVVFCGGVLTETSLG